MRRALAILLSCVAAVGAGGGPPSGRPATSPAATRPASAPGQAARPTAAERLARARKLLQYHRRTVELARAGRYAECEPILREILELDPTDSTAWYNLACVHSRLGRREQALACLNRSLEHGYADFRHMARDPDMDPLRELEGYQKIVARNAEVQRRRAERIRGQLREQFGEGYICEVDHAHKLVFATNIDRRALDELRSHLTACAKAQWEHLFTNRFEQYVTVVVPSPGDHERLRRRGVGGYYLHESHMLVARQIGMVMNHEFTHALHYADQDGYGQRHPIWIAEGLATLFESSRVEGGRVVPLPNHRLTLLRRLLTRKKGIPFETFFQQSRREFMRRAGAAYPQARYVMMYLHDRGLLKQWYDAYVAGYDDDTTGARAMEKVCGKPLAEIETDWKRWVARQKRPPLGLRPGWPYIGVRTRGQVDGLRIVQVLPGSGAANAGLKPGDVIVKIDGERMIDPTALLQFVAGHRPGDRIEVEYRRDGQYETVVVTLRRWSGRRPRSRPTPRSRPSPATPPGGPKPASRPARKAA